MPLFYRYDVELFQRIEHLIGKKLPLHNTEEEEVMLLMERVTDAQRYAKMVSVKTAFLESLNPNYGTSFFPVWHRKSKYSILGPHPCLNNHSKKMVANETHVLLKY
jgi:hypothetical protein